MSRHLKAVELGIDLIRHQKAGLTDAQPFVRGSDRLDLTLRGFQVSLSLPPHQR